jgi:hypothetical protein
LDGETACFALYIGVRDHFLRGALSMSEAERKAADTRFARPRFGRIPIAESYSGVSRSRLYELAAATPGLFRKNGTATIVDFDVLDQILDSLPHAEIKAPVGKARALRT